MKKKYSSKKNNITSKSFIISEKYRGVTVRQNGYHLETMTENHTEYLYASHLKNAARKAFMKNYQHTHRDYIALI